VRSRYFDDFAVGDRFTMAAVTVTEEQIVDFAFRWDPYAFHLDRGAAEAHPLGGLLSSGLHTLCLSFRQFAESGLLAASAISGAGIDRLRWVRPVRPGDTLHGVVEVIAVHPSRSRSDRGTIVMRHETMNQNGETVLALDCRHLVKRRAGGGQSTMVNPPLTEST